MHIVGISGSLRDDSVTRQMVGRVLSAAQGQGARIDLIDLKDYPRLPFCDGRTDSYGPQVEMLKKRLAKADAFVIGTPEYHGGYSAALKNFIDIATSHPFKDKLVALVGASGGRLGAEAAMNQLRIVFKNIESIVLPQQASATGKDINATRQINNPDVLARLNDIGTRLAGLTRQLKVG